MKDLSFETIPARGLTPRSRTTTRPQESNRKLGLNEIFLIDSGGQYLDGTTDITRTVIVGEPTRRDEDRFTRVLKGMIGLSMIRFPKGTTRLADRRAGAAAPVAGGARLRPRHRPRRRPYLSVHEGPARIKVGPHARSSRA